MGPWDEGAPEEPLLLLIIYVCPWILLIHPLSVLQTWKCVRKKNILKNVPNSANGVVEMLTGTKNYLNTR